MRKLLFILSISMAAITATAQQVYTSSGRPADAKKKNSQRSAGKGFDFSRMILGGGLGLGFGSQTTSFSISPIIGYRITDNVAAGVSFGYQYYRYKDFFELTDANGYTSFYDLKSSITSVGLWVRYLAFERLLLHAEFEQNFMRYQDYRFASNGSGNIEPYKIKYNAPALLVGVGYRQPITENASMYIILMYDLYNQIDPNRPINIYGNTLFPRIGFNIGF